MNIQTNIEVIFQKIKSASNKNVQLIAVSKTYPLETIQIAYDFGLRDFGENKVQELVSKYESLPRDIHWHLIGHLQTNKVKYIAPFVHLIHSVDSLKLLQEIDKQAQKNSRIIHCLLQVYIAQEETKFGLDFDETENLIYSESFKKLRNIQIDGLMGMASNTTNTEQVKEEFKRLKDFFEELKNRKSLSGNISMDILSIGMSQDFEIAIEQGSTMVRVGSAIFGSR